MIAGTAMAWVLLAWIPGSRAQVKHDPPPQIPPPAAAPEKTLPQNPSAPAEPSQPIIPGRLTDTHLDKTPPRKTKGLDLVKMGWSYNCMECHRLLEPRWHRDGQMVEHQNIVLDHGNNRFCLNCHHPTNRNAFVDYDGSEIPEAEVVMLCAKCHGPTYRDWKARVHGRVNGYWNTALGPRSQLRCIQCHDPHRPKFQPLKPLPPPPFPERAPRPPTGSHESGELAGP